MLVAYLSVQYLKMMPQVFADEEEEEEDKKRKKKEISNILNVAYINERPGFLFTQALRVKSNLALGNRPQNERYGVRARGLCPERAGN